MGWICGKHKPTVIADGEACAACNPPETIEVASLTDKRVVVLKRGTVGRGDNPTTVVP